MFSTFHSIIVVYNIYQTSTVRIFEDHYIYGYVVHILGKHIFLASLQLSLHKILRRLYNMGMWIIYLLDKLLFIIYIRHLLVPHMYNPYCIGKWIEFLFNIYWYLFSDFWSTANGEICNTWVSGIKYKGVKEEWRECIRAKWKE